MGNVVNPAASFRGRRVLVTGDTGFKGSWLALWLHEAGADVLGFALPPERPDDHFVLLGLDRRIRHVDGDIRDAEALGRTFSGFRPEFVFHLAAQSLVLASYDDPKETFDTNVAGSVNVLEQARRAPGLKALVYVTSDKCYRNKEWVWGYRETDELGGRDPYSASKAAAELVFEAYRQSFFGEDAAPGVASVRAGNVIGGGDRAPDRIIPDAVAAFLADKPLELRRPDAVRPWQHVLEPLGGYLVLARALAGAPRQYSGPWNFGPQVEAARTVRDLAQAFGAAWGKVRLLEASKPESPHEAGFLSLNCDKAFRLLGWRPRWGFEQTVRQTAAWYREVAAGAPAYEVSRRQIGEFQEAR